MAGHEIDPTGKSLVLINRNTGAKQLIAWLGSNNVKSLNGLARKTPHYGKYSYLVFTGERPDNQYKGQWPVTISPLQIQLSASAGKVKELRPTPLWSN